MTWEYKDGNFRLWKIKLIQTDFMDDKNIVWEYLITRAQVEPIVMDRGFFTGHEDDAPTLGDVMSQFVAHMSRIAFQITENA